MTERVRGPEGSSRLSKRPPDQRFTTSLHSGCRIAWARKNGQSGMIFQPPARACSTACRARAWPTPRPRSASGTPVWSMMTSRGEVREIGHFRLMTVYGDRVSPVRTVFRAAYLHRVHSPCLFLAIAQNEVGTEVASA